MRITWISVKRLWKRMDSYRLGGIILHEINQYEQWDGEWRWDSNLFCPAQSKQVSPGLCGVSVIRVMRLRPVRPIGKFPCTVRTDPLAHLPCGAARTSLAFICPEKKRKKEGMLNEFPFPTATRDVNCRERDSRTIYGHVSMIIHLDLVMRPLTCNTSSSFGARNYFDPLF